MICTLKLPFKINCIHEIFNYFKDCHMICCMLGYFQLPPDGVIQQTCSYHVLCSGDFSVSVHCTGTVGGVLGKTASDGLLSRTNVQNPMKTETVTIMGNIAADRGMSEIPLDTSQYSQVTLDTDSEDRSPESEHNDLVVSIESNSVKSVSPKHRCAHNLETSVDSSSFTVVQNSKSNVGHNRQQLPTSSTKILSPNSPSSGKKPRRFQWAYEPQIYVEVGEYDIS